MPEKKHQKDFGEVKKIFFCILVKKVLDDPREEMNWQLLHPRWANTDILSNALEDF